MGGLYIVREMELGVRWTVEVDDISRWRNMCLKS